MAWTKVKDGLFVGDASSAQDFDLIDTNSITFFVNCAASEVNAFWEGMEYLTFYWDDRPDCTIFDPKGIVVDQLVNFIDEGIRSGHSVLVFSTRGHSRAIACVVAYFMHKYGWGMGKVLEFLDSKRITTDLNVGFVSQLSRLDWSFQCARMEKLKLADADTRRRTSAAQRSRLLGWTTHGIHEGGPSDDLTADHLILVNSFVNGRSMFTFNLENLPKPTADGVQSKKSTAIRWIDDNDGSIDNDSQPILGMQEAPRFDVVDGHDGADEGDLEVNSL